VLAKLRSWQYAPSPDAGTAPSCTEVKYEIRTDDRAATRQR
jgi:hypothetical protein